MFEYNMSSHSISEEETFPQALLNHMHLYSVRIDLNDRVYSSSPPSLFPMLTVSLPSQKMQHLLVAMISSKAVNPGLFHQGVGTG